MEGILERADQDLAPLVVGHFGLLDQGYRSDEGLDCAGVVGGACVCHRPGDCAAGDGSVAAHDLFEFGFTHGWCRGLGSAVVDGPVVGEADRWRAVVDVTAALGGRDQTRWDSLLVEEGRVEMGIGDSRRWDRWGNALPWCRYRRWGPVWGAHWLRRNSNMGWWWLGKVTFPVVTRWWASGIRWRDTPWAHWRHGPSWGRESHVVGGRRPRPDWRWSL